MHSVSAISMERLQFVRLYRSLIFVQVCKWVLCAIVMGIIVCVNGLCLQSGNGIELFDGGCTQTGQSAEDCALDLCNLCILDGVDKGILGIGGMILKLLGGVLFAERCNLIEVHLQVVCHLLRKLVLWSC